MVRGRTEWQFRDIFVMDIRARSQHLQIAGIAEIGGNENDTVSLSTRAAISYPVFIYKRNNLL
jgi:hypothetical protein